MYICNIDVCYTIYMLHRISSFYIFYSEFASLNTEHYSSGKISADIYLYIKIIDDTVGITYLGPYSPTLAFCILFF